MRTALLPMTRYLLSAVALCAVMPVVAQIAAPQTAPAETPPLPTNEPRPVIEKITHEDALSRIDEVRVGGQTRSIDVKPKNGAPGYEIQPDSGAVAPSDSQGTAGRSRWRLFSF